MMQVVLIIDDQHHLLMIENVSIFINDKERILNLRKEFLPFEILDPYRDSRVS